MESFAKLSELKKTHRNFDVNFQMTVSKFNIDVARQHFDDIQKLAPFNIVTFAHEGALFHNQGKVLDKNDAEYEKKLAELLEYVESKIKTNTPTKLVQKVYLKLAAKYVRTKKMPVSCSSSFATLTIDPFGNVEPCPFLQKSMGNVRKNGYDLKKVVKSKEADELRDLIRKKQCPTCWMNCEAYPAIFESFPNAFLKYMK
jgi:MoaA/NifB/PqqE/SkfB family radical SAM enzyme